MYGIPRYWVTVLNTLKTNRVLKTNIKILILILKTNRVKIK